VIARRPRRIFFAKVLNRRRRMKRVVGYQVNGPSELAYEHFFGKARS
jgi:hypothetical protein